MYKCDTISSSDSFSSIDLSNKMSWKYWSFSLFSKWYTIVNLGGTNFRRTCTGTEGIRLPDKERAARSTNYNSVKSFKPNVYNLKEYRSVSIGNSCELKNTYFSGAAWHFIKNYLKTLKNINKIFKT